MQEIYFSVIVPVYNAEKYIERCIDNLMQQTYKNYEIILIDDGSEDSTGKICEKLEKLHFCIRYIPTTHSGVSRARNIGIRNAKGKYVLFVDVDDFIENEMLQELYALSSETNADVYFSNRHYVIRSGRKDIYTVFSVSGSLYREIYTPNQFLSVVACQNNNMPGSMGLIMVKRRFLLENKIMLDEDIAWSEDSDFCYKAFVYAGSIGVSEFCGYSWSNDNPQSSSMNISLEKVIGRMNVYKKWYEYFANNKEHHNLYNAVDAEVVAQKMLSNYCNYLIEYRRLKEKKNRNMVLKKLKSEKRMWKNSTDEKFKYYVHYGIRGGRVVTFLVDIMKDLGVSLQGKRAKNG